jgi:hypothetical protein
VLASRPWSPAADAPLILGDTVLERYRTLELIAKGGHSVVYRGKDERLERPVCIKVFTSVPGDAGIAQTSYEHFVQEAFALSRLTHPHTLRIYDFGHLGEATPFHVSEYMNGGTLTTQVKDHGRLDAAETLKVTRAMCDALAEAHSLGIIHRDVKPHNILFAMVGTARLAKLADFGVAKWHERATASASSSAARAGDTQVVSGQRMAMYSPSWAAPEQLAGQEVSPATDIYSLALVAVYMLTGRAIFADDDLYEGYRKRRHSDQLVAEALSEVELPAPARDLLARALRFHPDERPDDTTLFGVELAEAFEPITGPVARLPEATTRAPSPVELVPPPVDAAPALPARAGPPRPDPAPHRRRAVRGRQAARRVRRDDQRPGRRRRPGRHHPRAGHDLAGHRRSAPGAPEGPVVVPRQEGRPPVGGGPARRRRHARPVRPGQRRDRPGAGVVRHPGRRPHRLPFRRRVGGGRPRGLPRPAAGRLRRRRRVHAGLQPGL